MIDVEVAEVAQGQAPREEPARARDEQALARAVQPVMVHTINNSAGGHIIFQSAGSQDQQIYVEPTRVRLRKAILMALAMSICIAIIYWVFLTSAPTGRAFEGVTK
jgi:hypothetical protein